MVCPFDKDLRGKPLRTIANDVQSGRSFLITP
jgi:hypothetical protein